MREVQVARDGDHGDGGGLILRIKNGSGNWVFRFTAPSGRRREMGLGTINRHNADAIGKSITHARQQAHDARAKLQQNIDPIDARRAERHAHREAARKAALPRGNGVTLARACRSYFERVIEGNKSARHEKQWLASLEYNLRDHPLWHTPIGDITDPQLLDFMVGLQKRVPETARRIHQRLNVVFDDAQFRSLVISNPAASIGRRLREIGNKRERGHFNALPYHEVPQVAQRLRAMDGVAPRCLEFALLTAARTSEAIEAEWCEIDFDVRIWTVPARRMKGGEGHLVHLSDRALEILEGQAGLHSRFAFPSSAGSDRPMSNGGMLALLRRMGLHERTTVHGLRSTFSTWAAEGYGARPDVVEACLAHREQDRVRAAYNRATFADARSKLLAAWAAYCTGQAEPSNVLALRGRSTTAGEWDVPCEPSARREPVHQI